MNRLSYGSWSVYWNLMQRRVLAFVLGLLVGGAPEALALCHFACAASTADAMAEGHEGHSRAHPSTRGAAKTFNANPHVCTHADELPTVAVPIARLAAPPAALPTVCTTVPPTQGAARMSCGRQQTPPSNSLLTTYLRI